MLHNVAYQVTYLLLWRDPRNPMEVQITPGNMVFIAAGRKPSGESPASIHRTARAVPLQKMLHSVAYRGTYLLLWRDPRNPMEVQFDFAINDAPQSFQQTVWFVIRFAKPLDVRQ
jgi:hypothetical protein